MAKRSFNFDLTFKVLVITGLSLSLATPVIRGLGYSGPGFWASLFFTLAAVGFYLLLHYYPLTAIIFPVAFALLYRLYYLNPQLFIMELTALFSLKQPANSLFWPLVMIAIITLIVYLTVFRVSKPLPVLFAVGLGTTALLWYNFVDLAYPAAISFSAFWLMLLSYNRGSLVWAGAAGADQESFLLPEMRKTWLAYTATILSLAMLLALLLPKNIAPAPWYGLHNLVAEHFSFLHSLRPAEESLTRGDGGEFYLYEFGRQSEKELGGPLYLDSIVLLEVTGGGGTYLKGSVLDHYNGHSWSDTTVIYELRSLPLPPEKLLADLSKSELTIKHLRLRTSTLFTGLYPQAVKAPPGTMLVNGSGSLKLDKSVPLHYEYHVISYNLLYRPAVKDQVSADSPAGFSRYLELPDGLPARIIKLALEITAGQQSSYGKIKALEGYLRRHYSYTTEIPQTPEDRDFVDYFLFDLQEGYCTYFATALAVMGRAAGIPTRYVSGFVIPAEPASNGRYYIAGTDAHAWVEAYLPGLGWLPFEATPGYTTGASLPYRIIGDYLPDFTGFDPESVRESGSLSLIDFDPDRDRPYADSGNGLNTLEIINMLLIVTAIFFLLLLGGLVALVLFRLIKVKQSFKNLNGLSPRGQAVGYYNLTLIFLERLALGKYPGETPHEYSLRIVREVHLWNLNFREISAGVALALYSRQPLPPDLAWQARQFFQVIFNRYLVRAGRLTAFIEILIYGRYLLGKL